MFPPPQRDMNGKLNVMEPLGSRVEQARCSAQKQFGVKKNANGPRFPLGQIFKYVCACWKKEREKGGRDILHLFFGPLRK